MQEALDHLRSLINDSFCKLSKKGKEETQRNPCCWRALIMIIMITEASDDLQSKVIDFFFYYTRLITDTCDHFGHTSRVVFVL